MIRPQIPNQILLIEDSEEDYITVNRAFTKAGLRNKITWVKNADEAFDFLNDASKPLPGVILLDLNMPGIGGLELLSCLKKDETLKKIPIIVLTTSGDERDVDASYAQGANSYVQKPVEFQDFVRAVTQLKSFWFEISILPKTE